MERVLKELAELSNESALKIPLGKYSAKDLRSAVVRAATSQKITISTASDRDSLFVWRKFHRPNTKV
jgi:hypothetical protein